ncbi:MAG: phage holin family protein [Oscillospiraceae bacterium]|nr:phage holin family protein [Oscillospiraceae bacterium]
MKYMIMLLIVLLLAASDFLTGFIKGCINDRPRSAKMRKGGLNKLAELAVMATACGFEYGVGQLGKFYESPELAQLAGSVTAIGVFIYIAAMEIVSILENYAEINPEAQWVQKIVKKFTDKNE